MQNNCSKYFSNNFWDFLKKISLIGSFTTVVFSGILQVFVYFLGKYWLRSIGINVELNIFEQTNLTVGLILIITAALLSFYCLFLFFIFLFINEGLKFIKEWIEKSKEWLKQKTPFFKKNYSFNDKYGVLISFFVILPFLFLYNPIENRFLKIILTAGASFLFFLFPLRVFWKYLEHIVTKIRERNANTEDESTSCKKIWKTIFSVIFLLIGFSLPFLIVLLHLWFPYWVYIFFLSIVICAHFIAYFYLSSKNLMSIIFVIAIFVILALTVWFDIAERNAVEIRNFIYGETIEKKTYGYISNIPVFPKIEQGDIYIENKDFFEGSYKLEEFKTQHLIGNVLQKAKFIELKGSIYVFVPFDMNRIGILEIKDNKILKFVLSEL